ncbi:MAG: hypothetical protein V1772_11585, partial [Chloroflexota bacterium]
LVRRPAASGRARLGALALYLLATVAALYTHYYALSLVLAHNLIVAGWLVAQAVEARPRRLAWGAVAAWATLQLLVLASYAPWLLYARGALAAWPAVSAPIALPRLAADVARVFALGPTTPAQRTTWLGGLLLALLVVPGGLEAGRGRGRAGAPAAGDRGRGLWPWELGCYLAVPVLLMYLLSLSRPMYKIKFLLLATPPFYVLQALGLVALGRLAWRVARGRRWAVGVAMALLAGLTLAPVGVALRDLYLERRYQRDDYRGIVRYMEATAGPEDALLINAPAQIETVNYYYRGAWPEYPLPRQRPLDVAETEAELAEIVARHRRIYALYWATAESDPDGIIEGWLDRRCFTAQEGWFGNLRLVVYAVPRTAAHEIAVAHEVTFGDALRLRGHTLLTPSPESGDIVQLTLFWEALAPVATRYKVFVHLVDARGNIVGQRDGEPVGGSRPTTTWAPGELLRDNYGLLVPAASPPGAHTLRVGLYGLEDGQRLSASDGAGASDALDLAAVTIQRAPAPPPLEALDRAAVDDYALGPVRLVGHSLHRLGYEHLPEPNLRPGDVARMVLFWRAEAAPSAQPQDGGDSFVIALEDGRRRVQGQWTLRFTDGAYPRAAWSEGELVRDIHRLQIPPELAPGTYTLMLRPVEGGRGHRLATLTLRQP